VELLKGRGLDLDVQRLAGRDDTKPPRYPGQRRALQHREHDDDDEDDVEQPGRSRDPGAQRDRRQHDGDRAAQARPGQEGLLPPRHGEPTGRAHRGQPDAREGANGAGPGRQEAQRDHGHHHRRRAGEEHQHQPHEQRGQDLGGQPGGRSEQAQHDEQADLGQPAHPLGESPGRGPVRQSSIAERQCRHVDGQEAAGRGQRRGPVARHDEREDRDGV
jgi:hypothetical protein